MLRRQSRVVYQGIQHSIKDPVLAETVESTVRTLSSTRLLFQQEKFARPVQGGSLLYALTLLS